MSSSDSGPSKLPANNKCSTCTLSKICIPDHLSDAGLEELERFLEASVLYRNGETIFSVGQRFEKIYAVKSGMIKTVTLNQEGKEFIDGFHLPGEVFALDAIHPQKYLSTAYAIGTSAVCSIDYTTLEHLATHLPNLQRQMFGLLSKALNQSHEFQIEMSAEQKLATFILDLSRRYKMRGYSELRMNLAMPQRDIANHLNMVPETVSRLLKRFHQQSIIHIERTDLSILSFATLNAITNGNHSTRSVAKNAHDASHNSRADSKVI